MRPILTDRIAWSVGLSVCRSVTLVSPAKTAATTELHDVWVEDLGGPENHVLDRVQIAPWEGANFWGRMGIPL